MTDLEKRFLSKKHRTSIKPGDKNAELFLKILKKMIIKRPYNTKGCLSNWWSNFDAIYS